MRFLRPNVPSLSQIDSSFSPLIATGLGDFGLAVAISCFLQLSPTVSSSTSFLDTTNATFED